jgi:phosphatidylglycerophosphatase C
MSIKSNVVVFDFDGTITRNDSFFRFIVFVFGKTRLFLCIIFFSPFLFAFLLHLYPNWKIKQRIFSYFFSGMSYSDFCSFGEAFSSVLSKYVRNDAREKILFHLKSGDDVLVVSASVENWIKPCCESLGIKNVIGTIVEVDNSGFLTGKFLSKNCYGIEKVKRLLKVKPERNCYYLISYGDSKGDFDILAFSDERYYKVFKR